MKVYTAQHCPDIYESAYYTLSVHLSEQGAKKAIRNSRRRCLREFNSYHYEGRTETINDFQAWGIKEYDVLP